MLRTALITHYRNPSNQRSQRIAFRRRSFDNARSDLTNLVTDNTTVMTYDVISRPQQPDNIVISQLVLFKNACYTVLVRATLTRCAAIWHPRRLTMQWYHNLFEIWRSAQQYHNPSSPTHCSDINFNKGCNNIRILAIWLRSDIWIQAAFKYYDMSRSDI